MRRLEGPKASTARLRGVVAVAIIAALVAGCGSSGSSSKKTDPTAAVSGGGDAIVRAAYVSSTAKGYKIRLSLSVSGTSLGAAVTGSGTGSFDVPAHAGELSFSFALPGVASALGPIALHEVVSDQKVYIELPKELSGVIGSGKPWVELDLGAAAKAGGLSSLEGVAGSSGATNPTELLQYLRAVSTAGVKDLGSATVDGIPTTHYRASIDLAKVAAAVPAADRAAVARGVAALRKMSGLMSVPVDVYIDSAHLIRRLSLDYTVSAGGRRIGADIRIDFLSYGAQPLPTVPPTSEVTQASALMRSGSASGSFFG